MKKNILAITTSRSDYGIFEEILKKLNESNKINLNLVVAGSHLDKNRSFSIKEIIGKNFMISNIIKEKLNSTNDHDVSKIIGKYILKFSKIINEKRPDLLVVFGDRYEVLSFVIPSLIFKIPIAHIGGGDITSGAIDDSVRHAITKMSNIHFVTHEKHRNRLIQMGEKKQNTFVIGSPGFEKVRKTKFIKKITLEKLLGFKFLKKNILITFHPTTSEISKDKIYIKELLDALKRFKDTYKIFTMPNSDSGGDIIKNEICKYVKKDKNSTVFNSLGIQKYLSCMKFVDCVVGNSSSGLIEAPALKKISINIGKRQNGRIIPESVLNCSNNSKEISNSIKIAFKKKN